MNAKKELMRKLEAVNAHRRAIVLCWSIQFFREGCYEPIGLVLKRGHSNEEYEAELNKLDFEYDDGFGEQVLFGAVILSDGSWLERDEYDGSEKWVWKSMPMLPECE